MGSILHANEASLPDAIKSAIGGGERHRLCFDFNSIAGLKDFFVRVKQGGITHPDSVPVLLHNSDGQTVWLVGFKKSTTIVETLGDV